MDHKTLETLQDIIKKIPVIIVGSGASIPLGLPSMSDLSARILENLDLKDLPQAMQSEFSAFKIKILKTDDFERAMDEIHSDELKNICVKVIWENVLKLDIDAKHKVLKSKNQLGLYSLLNSIATSTKKEFHVITTNYDRIVEYVADAYGIKCFDGWKGRYLRHFSDDFGQNSSNKITPYIQLYKVHGSIDWYRLLPDKNLISHETSPQCDFIPLLVSPGEVKHRETQTEPFRDIISAADNALKKAETALCYGFGFNDAHIQEKLTTRIKEGLPTLILARTLSSNAKEAIQSSAHCYGFEKLSSGKSLFVAQNESYEVDGDLWDLNVFMKKIM